MQQRMIKYLQKDTEAAPLAVFRILFGVLMFLGIIRFWLNGWIEKLYIEPKFHFHYYGFEWVSPFGNYTYVLFILSAIAALGVAFGYKYRLSIVLYFLSFTYIELLDKTTYLNHYYFISVVSFLLIFLPAQAYFSVDALQHGENRFQKIRQWHIDILKLILCLVYFYAGLAKINHDWLIEALPLKIWLPSKYTLPILGGILQKEWVAYVFSWAGMVYDLMIPFLLLNKKTRNLAFFLVVVFHLLTSVLFPIGMFPYIMIMSAFIFFDAAFHHALIQKVSSFFRFDKTIFDNGISLKTDGSWNLKLSFLALFLMIQFVLPFRFLGYPGNLFWNEEGYRFSWRVMLMEKTGYANFKLVDKDTGNQFYVNNSEFLTPFQEKQMSTQPDFILEYARFLGNHYKSNGVANPAVFVESYVALNGKGSRQYIDFNTDLLQESESFKHKNWVLPFHE